MNYADLVAALDLPTGSRVDQRVPKKLLLENGAPTAADKRHINQGVEELFWLAALKPTTIGVPAYRDDSREYLEIAVLRLALRAGAKAPRLVELVHRAVPYPMLLLTLTCQGASLSAAHKRWSQGESGKTVLDGKVIEVALDGGAKGDILRAFQAEVALARQPRGSLFALYQGWIGCLTGLLVARITEGLALPESAASAAALREGVDSYDRLQRDIALLRKQATKERQINRRVELNLQIKRLEAELAAATHKLRMEGTL